jgi:hypothetical protein
MSPEQQDRATRINNFLKAFDALDDAEVDIASGIKTAVEAQLTLGKNAVKRQNGPPA